MNSANDYFNKLINNIKSDINSCLIGRIEKFSGSNMKADVLPLHEDKSSMLINLPVASLNAGGFIIKPPYQKGDLVLVVFADSDIDNILYSGNVSNATSVEKHALKDGIVVGGILPFTKSIPNINSNDLVIGKSDLSGNIIFKSNGSIEIKSNRGVTIKGSSRTESW